MSRESDNTEPPFELDVIADYKARKLAGLTSSEPEPVAEVESGELDAIAAHRAHEDRLLAALFGEQDPEHVDEGTDS